MSKDKVTDKGAVSIDEDALEQASGGVKVFDGAGSSLIRSAAPKPPTELKIKLQDSLISSIKQP